MLDKFLNLKAYHQSDLFDPRSRAELGKEGLVTVLPPSLADLELSRDKYVAVPNEVRQIYSTYRPTPLLRATQFEKAIGTTCEIYFKDEGGTPTGNHKINSAYLIAYLCKQDGVRAIATETTGNWGIAMAMAGREFGIKVICFIDKESDSKRPDRKPAMEAIDAEVVVVEPSDGQAPKDLLTLSANAAIEFTRQSKGTCYVFGSVYGYFILPQSLIGLEIKDQLAMQDRYPDIVVGTCGGGANLLGTAGVFLADIVDEHRNTRVVSAEAANCPILSEGKMGLYSIDTVGYFPLLKTYGIDGLRDGEYVGGLGSTTVASSVAFFHDMGLIQSDQVTAEEAHRASETLYRSEHKLVALETGYTVAAVIRQALKNERKVIVANISSGETDRQFYEESLLRG